MRSLEQTLSAVVLASAREQPPVPAAWRAEMERMAERSRERYRALVYEDPDFARFFEQATPLAELTSLNIGSRPSKRAAGGIEALRAIPWVFAWTQNRLLLPSWYGAGAALAEGDLELQRDMAAGWPFFASLLSTLEMALYKTDLGVAERYLRLVEPALRDRFWPDIAREHDQVVGRLLEITGAPSLLDDQPALQRPALAPQPVDRPALAPAGRAARARARRPRRGARAAAGHDHRHRRRDAQHGLTRHAVESRFRPPVLAAGRGAAVASRPWIVAPPPPHRRAGPHRRAALALRRPALQRVGGRPARADHNGPRCHGPVTAHVIPSTGSSSKRARPNRLKNSGPAARAEADAGELGAVEHVDRELERLAAAG